MIEKVGIVILNFNNYHETFSCVSSIREKIASDVPIAIVENGSSNDSYAVLKEAYESDPNITVIQTEKNLGFANGNNVGIRYLRKTRSCDYILLLNSDTVIVEDDYLEKLLSLDKNDVGLIESNVKERKGTFSQPFNCYPYFSFCLWLFFSAFCDYNCISYKKKYNANDRESFLCQVGCAMLLTPAYFNFYDGLYSKTFLYGEEIILLILLRKAGLRVAYCEDTYIFHNEGGSTELKSLSGSAEKNRKVIEGYKNALIASLIPLSRLKKLTRGRGV